MTLLVTLTCCIFVGCQPEPQQAAIQTSDRGVNALQLISPPLQKTKVVSSYTELDEVTSPVNLVVVLHELYGGEFALSLDQISPGNGGTRRQLANGFYFDRVWDGKHAYVDWWVVGEPGVTSADDQFYQASIAVNRKPDGTLLPGLGAVIGGNRTYVFDTGCVLFEGCVLDLNLSTITRRDAIVANLVTAASSGSNTIVVDDASGFNVGDKVGVGLGGGGQADSRLSNAATITAIDGNSLTLGLALDEDGLAGDKVFSTCQLFTLVSSKTKNLIVEGGLITGNLAGNSESEAWIYNASIVVNQNPMKLDREFRFSGIRFEHTPGENLIIPTGSTVEACQIKSAMGSFIHLSSGIVDDQRQTYIANNICENVCQSLISGHNDAVVTWSANVRNVRIDNLLVNGSGQGCLGSATGTSNKLIVTNSEFHEATRFLQWSHTTTNDQTGNLVFSNVRGKNVGDAIISAKQVEEGLSVNDISFSHCHFEGNTRFAFRDCVNISFNDVVVIIDDSATFSSALLTDNYAINFQECNRIQLSNLNLFGPELIKTNVVGGIILRTLTNRKDSEDNDLNVRYMSNVTLDNVNVLNFQKGITANRADSIAITQDATVEGWVWNDVSVWGYQESNPNPGQSWGVDIPPGCLAKNVSFWAQHTTQNNSFIGIHVQGVSDANAASQRGAILDGYLSHFVAAAPNRGVWIGPTSGTDGRNNVILRNGISSHGIAGVDNSKSSIDSPEDLLTILPNYTAPQPSFAGQAIH